jgi:NAD(P)-dependent dehydrogenase (short-subunit alcohol dehydrogenase family)
MNDGCGGDVKSSPTGHQRQTNHAAKGDAQKTAVKAQPAIAGGRLEGKVGIIMGGASPNMGGTVAHLMAQEGAKVFINDIDAEIVKGTVEFLKSRGFEAAGAVGDASDEEQVADVVEKAVAAFGTIDLLYNNAGWHYFAQILDTELEPWNDQFRRNMTAAMLTTKHVGRVMADHGRGGSIVHTASDAGHQGEAGSPGYSGVKAGLINFARAAAMDLAQHGVRVNTVSPTFNLVPSHGPRTTSSGAYR